MTARTSPLCPLTEAVQGVMDTLGRGFPYAGLRVVAAGRTGDGEVVMTLENGVASRLTGYGARRALAVARGHGWTDRDV